MIRKQIPEIGEAVFVRSRRARRYSISISQSLTVRVTVPWYGTFAYGERLLKENAAVIVQRIERMRERVSAAVPDTDGKTVEQLRKEAKEVLPGIVAAYASALGLSYSRVTIKHNRSNWGGCSTKGNINLNLNLMRVPEDLRSYVILHELSHLRYMNHGPEFHSYLDSACKTLVSPDSDEREMARRLKSYRLI